MERADPEVIPGLYADPPIAAVCSPFGASPVVTLWMLLAVIPAAFDAYKRK
jgi:hypothetical protein